MSADHLHRREFAWQCLGGIGAASLIGGSSSADDKPKPADPADPADEPEKKTPPAELLILSALMQMYPSEHYDEDAVRGIYRDIAGDVARGKQLREFSLKNSDEPAMAFRVFRAASAEGTP
jgi:hypothetical protein